MPNFHLNYPAVVVAALIQCVIGVLWYGVFFKKSWSSLLGFKEGEKPKGAVFATVSSFVASILLCFVLANVMLLVSRQTFIAGLSIGIVCWLGFMAPPMFAQHIYERRPANLFAINAAYWLVAMAIGGGVLAVWR